MRSTPSGWEPGGNVFRECLLGSLPRDGFLALEPSGDFVVLRALLFPAIHTLQAPGNTARVQLGFRAANGTQRHALTNVSPQDRFDQ